MRDIYHSARNNFRECKYYLRDERDSIGDLSVWILKNIPAGSFMAMEINTRNKQGQQLANVFMYDADNVTLKTEDLVDDLTRGCIVYYLGHAWIVDSVQRQVYLNESQFSLDQKVSTLISLRR